MTDIETDLDELLAQAKAAMPVTWEYSTIFYLISRLRTVTEALKSVLDHEALRAPSGRPNDCGCINISAKFERLYENGKCPHQLARIALGIRKP